MNLRTRNRKISVALAVLLASAAHTSVPAATTQRIPGRQLRNVPSQSVAPFAGLRRATAPGSCAGSGSPSFTGYGGGAQATTNYAGDAAGDFNSACQEFSFIGGGQENAALATAEADQASFIGGGFYNQITSGASGIGAGRENQANGDSSFVVAGSSNTVSGVDSFIGAGDSNTIGGNASSGVILGGDRNEVLGTYGTVLGGYGNDSTGSYAIVAGGDANESLGTLSFAAGYHAHATKNGSFVWADYTSGKTLSDTAANQFVVRATGGYRLYSNAAATAGVYLAAGSGAWASLSDRNAKTDIVPLDDGAVLAKVARLPVSEWSYTSERGVRHVGPMAQDFYAAFGTGPDSRHITSIDEDGVALAAIKSLNAKVDRKDREIDALRARVREIDVLRARDIDALRTEIRKLERASGVSR